MKKFEERDWVQLENHGLKIFGVFHRPLHVEKAPAVLMCHGFGGHKTGRYRIYVLLSEMLAKAGIASFRFDFRCSGDSEGDFTEMTLDGEVSDTLLATDYLEKNPHVDSSRMGILGRSLGGIVAILAAKRNKKFKSLALWSPAFNGKQWLEKWMIVQNPNISKDSKEEIMRFNGQLANEKFLKQFFAVEIDSELAALDHLPLLHIHGEQDFEVDMNHADHYFKCRENASGQTCMIRLPNTDHDFTNPKERQFALEETWLWFKKTL